MKYKSTDGINGIDQFLIITEKMLRQPVIWPNEPFVYQFKMFSNRPLPAGIEVRFYSIEYMDTVMYPDGTITPLWDDDLIYYDSWQNAVFVESIRERNSNWPELVRRICPEID